MLKRASDADRQQCLEDLRAAYASGCLGTDDLERRAGAAVRATTRIELWALTVDLPRRRLPRWATKARAVDRAVLRAHAATYAAANGSLVGLWAVAGAEGFWPALVLVPWTPLLAWHAWSSRAIRRVVRRRMSLHAG